MDISVAAGCAMTSDSCLEVFWMDDMMVVRDDTELYLWCRRSEFESKKTLDLLILELESLLHLEALLVRSVASID